MIEIKREKIFNKENLNFLVQESLELFLKLRDYSSISEEQKIEMKETLKQMYIDQTSENQTIYTIYFQEEIIGCACITDHYINDLFIKKEYQRQGIGTLVLNRIIKDFGKECLTFHTYLENLDFFQKRGFTLIEENVDSIKMQR